MTLLFIYLAIAVGISFICSILEAVLLSITPSYVESIAAKYPKRGKVVQSVKDRLDQSIASILILNTFAQALSLSQGYESQILRAEAPVLPAHRGAKRIRLPGGASSSPLGVCLA